MVVYDPDDSRNSNYRIDYFVNLSQISNKEFTYCKSEKRIGKLIFSLLPKDISEF